MRSIALLPLLLIFTNIAPSQSQPLSLSISQPSTISTADALKTIVGSPSGQPRGLVIIAPAKKYLMEERLFLGLANSLNQAGFITVRFNWRPSTLAIPEQELARAAADLQGVVQHFQQLYKVLPSKTAIITKSFSTKALKRSVYLARHHVLLTPNCSAQEPFRQTYQDILRAPALSLTIAISNEDPNCDVRQIYDALRLQTTRPQVFITHGDHNFVLQAGSTMPFLYQNQIFQIVTSQLLIDFSK